LNNPKCVRGKWVSNVIAELDPERPNPLEGSILLDIP